MNMLIWRAHQWLRRFGRTGLAGVLLLIAAALMQFGQVATTDAESAALKARLDTLHLVAKTEPGKAAVPAVGRLDALPDTTAAPALIGQLEQVARAHKVQLLRGQYSQTPIVGTSLVRWQLALPINADYPHIHAFVADSLQKLSALTLEDIRLKRENIGTTDVTADLHFSLYLRESAP